MPRKTVAQQPAHEAPEPEGIDDAQMERLSRLVALNPFVHLPQFETRCLFGFGRDFFRRLVDALKPPMVRNKFNPDHFKRWLWEHREEVAKLSE